MRKILYYNWVPLNQSDGGGVAVYQKNLLTAFSQMPECEVYYLSAGYTYDLSQKIKIVAYEGMKGIRCYDILNSPVIAPGNLDSANLKKYLEDESLKTVIEQFIAEHGQFDVIHLNNIEGLTLAAIKALKACNQNTKLVYSGHNYFPLCPQVNLWQSTAAGCHNCSGRVCVECAENSFVMRGDALRLRRVVKEAKGSYKIARVASRIFKARADGEVYNHFLYENLLMLNDTVDVVLAVSKRVGEIFVKNGVRPDKILLSYIGTKAAENAKPAQKLDNAGETLKLIYMGYMRQEKGGDFMLNAMERMPDALAGKLDVLFVAKNVTKHKTAMHRLDAIKPKFAALKVKDGYQRSEQEELLKDRELGIVPVQWEDNLPQVAIEQIAAGVPILTSNLGGAAELFNHKQEFVFCAEEAEQFIEKLTAIVENKTLLNDFWKAVNPLFTMDMHLRQLREIYGE